MILVFAGWGILGVLVPLLFGALAYGLASAAGLGHLGAYAALGVALSGLVVRPLGKRLNGGSAEQVARWRERRQAELSHIVEHGAYLRPDGTRPTSLAQARAEADQQLESETALVRSRMTNRHSLFFVPLQHVGVVLVVAGLVAAVVLYNRP